MVELQDNSFQLGELLAIRDEDFLTEHQFDLVEFDAYTDDPERINVSYYGTFGTKLDSPFKKAWIDHKDNTGILANSNPRTSSKVERYTAEDVLVSDVIARGLELTKAGKLRAASKKKLKGYRPTSFNKLGQEIRWIQNRHGNDIQVIDLYLNQ